MTGQRKRERARDGTYIGIRARGLSDSAEGSWRDKTTQENVQDWLELNEGYPGFQYLTEEEIPADVKASVMEEGSENELDEPQVKKKILRSARDGIDAVINYVGSSTNRQLQAYCEHLHLQ
jgi:hypothetical protein